MRSDFSIIRKLTAALSLFIFVMPSFAVTPAVRKGAKPLTEDQKIIHVLNRLGYGARPGDVQRVKAIGIQKYIEQQLDPASISDSIAESKVNRLDIFGMTTGQVFAKYPNPGALLRQLEGGRRTQTNPRRRTNTEMAGEAMTNAAAQEDPATPDARRERQQKLAKLYREHGLRPARQLMPQIAANRILRAVYSERQLQEVMVDFWKNHFNVYAGKGAVRWYVPSYERDVLRKNALGNFKDLVVGTAQHPAMLFFLDNFESVSPKAQLATRGNGPLQRAVREGRLTPRMRERIKQRQGLTDGEIDQRFEQAKSNMAQRNQRGINENYARELMELHTLGVDGGYTQKHIV